MQGKEIHPGKAEFRKGQAKNALKLIRIGLREDLGLKNEGFAGEFLQNRAKLNLGRAVTPGGFKVANAQFHRPGDDLFKVGLVFRRDRLGRIFLPAMLEAHATAGQDRHG